MAVFPPTFTSRWQWLPLRLQDIRNPLQTQFTKDKLCFQRFCDGSLAFSLARCPIVDAATVEVDIAATAGTVEAGAASDCAVAAAAAPGAAFLVAQVAAGAAVVAAAAAPAPDVARTRAAPAADVAPTAADVAASAPALPVPPSPASPVAPSRFCGETLSALRPPKMTRSFSSRK